jgi:hypothetical protein
MLGTGKQSREVHLTRMMLTEAAGQSLLPTIKTFWLEHFHRRTCFYDLQRMIGQLTPTEAKSFHDFINTNAHSRTPDTESEV